MGFSVSGNGAVRPQTPQFVPARFGAPLESHHYQNQLYDYQYQVYPPASQEQKPVLSIGAASVDQYAEYKIKHSFVPGLKPYPTEEQVVAKPGTLPKSRRSKNSDEEDR